MGLSFSTLPVNIPSTVQLTVTPEQFVEIAIANRDLKLERTVTGELIVMPPTGGITGKKNIDLEGQLWLWNRQTKLGQVFNSSTGFLFPNGANRSPDAAWICQERWDQLTFEQQEGFPPLSPDFVLELRSKTDSLNALQEKMQEYMDNGVRLGWLIDRKHQTVSIYRQNQDIEILQQPLSLSGENILPGFVLDLTEIWQ